MPYRLIDRQVLYNGKKMRLELHHLEDEDGQRTWKEVVAHPGAVCIVPVLDEKAGQILLIRNRRVAVNQVLYELPAGTLEKGEPPLNCAGRELLEETGYLARRLKPIASFYTSPGILTEKMHAFAAYDLTSGAATLEIGEEIEVEPIALDAAIDMIRTGGIIDGKTIATLMIFDRFFRSPRSEAGNEARSEARRDAGTALGEDVARM
jgi:ADP-ribose pyrophosphatase